jgi:small subunit ribosomal protein S1
MSEETDAMQKVTTESSPSSGTTSLGALLKAKMDVKNIEQ